MGGRGRGRGGANLSLTQEQLHALGVSRGENNAPTLAPPPTYPRIEAKPLPLVCDAAMDYMLIVKDQFINYLHESPAYVTPRQKTDGVERYSDKYKILAEVSKHNSTLDCVWKNIPTELHSQNKRVVKAKKRKLDDPKEIAKRLQNLEQKELNDKDGENADDDNKVKNENPSDDEVDDEQEDEEEIDDGTDYANNYFDNGEDYDEEDDNLDDGPVY